MLDFSLDATQGEFVEKIHQQSNKFAMGVANKGTGDSNLNDSPDKMLFH